MPGLPSAPRGRKARALLHGEAELWRHATRDVQPLPRRAKPASPEPSPLNPAKPASTVPEPPPRRTAETTALAGRALPPIDERRAPGLDRASAERLKRGRYPIDARLDLHGMVQEEAHRALIRFITDAVSRGQRCVLVITGKGLRRLAATPDAPFTGDLGILRAAVPRWLAEPALREDILAVAGAQPRHGGGGALYVLLRRQR